MIASCDVSHRIVMAELGNGAFIRSFTSSDHSVVQREMLLLDAGFLAVLSEKRAHNQVSSIVQVYGLNTDVLGAYTRDETVTAWCPINRIDGASMLAIAFETGYFIILSGSDCTIIANSQFESPIMALYHDPVTEYLFLGNQQSQILSAKIDFSL
jgi:hypothetical protein